MVSFLKKDQTDDSFAKSDWLFLTAIIAVVGGFWYYSHHSKTVTHDNFANALEVYNTGDCLKALDAYVNLLESPYMTDSLDSIRAIYESELDDKRENHLNLMDEMKFQLGKGDTAKAIASMQAIGDKPCLEEADLATIAQQKVSLASWKPAVVDTSAKSTTP